MRNAKYKLEHRDEIKHRRRWHIATAPDFDIRAFLLWLFDTKHTRTLLLVAALLALVGCRPAAPVSFDSVVTVPPEPASPDDKPVDWPEVKPVSVPAAPAKSPEAPAGYECKDGVCAPVRSFREEQPVRRVLSRIPVVRRFGR